MSEATIIRTDGAGHFVVVIDGKPHTLRALLGVDTVRELTGQEAVDFLTEAVDRSYAQPV